MTAFRPHWSCACARRSDADHILPHQALGCADGNLSEAMRLFGESLGIRLRPTESNPANAEWQRDVAASHSWLAKHAEASGDEAASRAEWRDATSCCSGCKTASCTSIRPRLRSTSNWSRRSETRKPSDAPGRISGPPSHAVLAPGSEVLKLAADLLGPTARRVGKEREVRVRLLWLVLVAQLGRLIDSCITFANGWRWRHPAPDSCT